MKVRGLNAVFGQGLNASSRFRTRGRYNSDDRRSFPKETPVPDLSFRNGRIDRIRHEGNISTESTESTILQSQILARAIRTRLGYTQSQFGALLNVPIVTAVSWENGTRKPSGAALRLLSVAKHHPEALQAA
jgi:DNA-binding transcriptional regulator YiaG